MRRSPESIDPVVKARELSRSAAEAFDLFTAGIGRWWPLTTHSIGGAEATTVRFEGRIGGRIVEVTADGTEHSWADVIAWDPPHRFVVAWHPTPEPLAASILEVRFESIPTGCRIHLEHRGWEEFGLEAGGEARASYEPGWDHVLRPYLAAAESEPARA